LCTDEDGGALRVNVQVGLLLAAHEDVDANLFAEPQIPQPVTHIIPRLLYERSHRQAIDEAARPVLVDS
jgi:hypothetical protein